MNDMKMDMKEMDNLMNKQTDNDNFCTRSMDSGLAASEFCLNPATRSIASRLATRPSAARFSRVSGFTLIEVMVVIVILGILAALIVPKVMGRGEKARVDTTKIALKSVAGALVQYKLDNGRYPSVQDGGLDALVHKPATAKNWLPEGYLPKYPKDSWENDIQYVIPGAEGRKFDLYSFGADGKEGGEENDADIYYQP